MYYCIYIVVNVCIFKLQITTENHQTHNARNKLLYLMFVYVPQTAERNREEVRNDKEFFVRMSAKTAK